jgi:hypothetical protein
VLPGELNLASEGGLRMARGGVTIVSLLIPEVIGIALKAIALQKLMNLFQDLKWKNFLF